VRAAGGVRGQGERLEAQGGRSHLIELRVFELRAGADEAEFLAADAAFQTEVIYRQPGIARRTTARGIGSNSWLVLTLWNTVEDCEAAPASNAALDALVDPSTVRVARFEELPG
jgi:hypothetical protein